MQEPRSFSYLCNEASKFFITRSYFCWWLVGLEKKIIKKVKAKKRDWNQKKDRLITRFSYQSPHQNTLLIKYLLFYFSLVSYWCSNPVWFPCFGSHAVGKGVYSSNVTHKHTSTPVLDQLSPFFSIHPLRTTWTFFFVVLHQFFARYSWYKFPNLKMLLGI